MNPHDTALNRSTALPLPRTGSVSAHTPEVQRVLRNTYGLLGLTLLFSAAVAAGTAAMGLPHPGLVITLIGSFGLLFATAKLANSGWGLLAVFALTGFMGYTLGPVIGRVLTFPGGAQVVTMALAATAVTFFALSAYVLTTRRDFSFMGGFLFAGLVIALLAGIGAMVFEVPALSLAVSAIVVLLSAGLILFETSRIVSGGETNYVMATVGLYVSIFNLFSALLALFGYGGGDD
jgi:modulator of FtsH protease